MFVMFYKIFLNYFKLPVCQLDALLLLKWFLILQCIFSSPLFWLNFSYNYLLLFEKTTIFKKKKNWHGPKLRFLHSCFALKWTVQGFCIKRRKGELLSCDVWSIMGIDISWQLLSPLQAQLCQEEALKYQPLSAHCSSNADLRSCYGHQAASTCSLLSLRNLSDSTMEDQALSLWVNTDFQDLGLVKN